MSNQNFASSVAVKLIDESILVLEACSGDCHFLFGANAVFFQCPCSSILLSLITGLTMFCIIFFINNHWATVASLNKINPDSAGIDIGASKIFIAVEDCEVKSFNTFTDDYLKAIVYLKEHNITSVAMKATGVYRIPLFEMLEASDIEVCLVNGRDVKNVPGRKSDVAYYQWIQQLHSYGLLRLVSFPMMPSVSYAPTFTSEMITSLWLLSIFNICMNIKLNNVISQIHGKSGMRVLNAIIN